MRRTTLWALGILVIAGGIACSHSSSSSPIAPSSASSSVSPGAGAGTAIRGTANVRGSGGASNALALRSLTSTLAAESDGTITVCVVDTDVCAGVDEAGNFELIGDFSGDVHLHFFGGAQNVELIIRDVQPGDIITITVDLNGDTGTIRIESREAGDDGEEEEEAEEEEQEDESDDQGDGDASGQMVDLCHRTGTGWYIPITVNVNAEATHRRHGDGMVGEEVPADPSKTFGPDCAVEGVEPPPGRGRGGGPGNGRGGGPGNGGEDDGDDE